MKRKRRIAIKLSTKREINTLALPDATLTGAMHGVNLLLICMLPQCFEKYGNISTVSGVLNACTYIGSALSTYCIAALSEVIGWQGTIFLWFLVTMVGAAVCLLCFKPWKKKFIDQ